ncbi:alpha/beta hydrolase-fold protein [Fluviicola sp.]|uniref:alpha/beta hydrolase n=1 Tax=Fluviicola sp. TaxID=1917219 RepID=UPI0031D06684
MKHLLSLLFLLFVNSIFAQEQIEHLLKSKVFGTERKVTVYLPAEYLLDQEGKFPVAYLFDGQFEPYLKMVSGMMEYYSQTNLCNSLVIVAVHTTDRFGEFVPEPKTDANQKTTYSTKLTDFLEQELFQFIDSAYRTTRFKLGIGHSLGGTFLLYEAFKPDSPFGAIIAASPNTNMEGMTKMIPEYLDKHPEMNTFFYVTGGDTDQMELDFLRTTMQIDSSIKARNSGSLDWNFRKYEHSNHMETFPKTFNDGYLLFVQHWKSISNDFSTLKGLQGPALEEAVKKLLAKTAANERTEMPYSFREVSGMQRRAEMSNEYQLASNICGLLIPMVETGAAFSKEEKEGMIQWLKEKQLFLRFQDICNNAQIALDRKDYKLAAQEYSRAFDMNIIRGTFAPRLKSLEAFAQSGNTEAAFKQLDLLANHYQLRGSSSLRENALLSPLHKDKRWNKYLKILDENTKLKAE